MEHLCADLQKMILDKTNIANKMTFAFYRKHDDTHYSCVFYATRNMNDPEYLLNLHIYQHINHDDKYDLITIMVRNKRALYEVISKAIYQRWDPDAGHLFSEDDLSMCYIQGEHDVPKEIVLKWDPHRKGFWGFSWFIGGEDVELSTIVKIIYEDVEALVALA